MDKDLFFLVPKSRWRQNSLGRALPTSSVNFSNVLFFASAFSISFRTSLPIALQNNRQPQSVTQQNHQYTSHTMHMLTVDLCITTHSTSRTCCRHSSFTATLRGGYSNFTLPKWPFMVLSINGRHKSTSCTHKLYKQVRHILQLIMTLIALYYTTTGAKVQVQCQSYSCSHSMQTLLTAIYYRRGCSASVTVCVYPFLPHACTMRWQTFNRHQT